MHVRHAWHVAQPSPATRFRTPRSRARARALVAGIFTFLIGSLALFPARVRAGECSGLADKSVCPEPVSVESARGLGLGTGLRATSVSTSALAYSPAALALGNLYHIEGNIDYIGVGDAVALGGAVVDSSTSKLGAGIGLRGFLSGDGGYDGLDGRLGLGFAISEAFALGLAGRYISLSTEETIGDETESRTLVQGFTLDASLRVMPAQGLQIDLAVLNFVDLEDAEAPVTLAGGLAFAVAESFSLGGDVLVDLSSFDDPALTLGAGLELLLGNSVPLRAGYRGDLARETHAVTAGLGYIDTQVGFDIGLRQNVAGDNETRVMAAVRYFVN